jgi:hypothetical protein
MTGDRKTFETAARRWEGLGPYYAMFPIRFADAVVKEYTDRGNAVLDPFAGRGTAVFSAAVHGRVGFGIEVSPVGWVYAEAKLRPGELTKVERRLSTIGGKTGRFAGDARALPKFFHRCFSREVRRFLLAIRTGLDWHRNRVDRTLMALVLVYLHGKQGQALSNQMRQTKAMSPHYAVKWWAENETEPPDLDPVEFMRQRIRWRYAKGVAETGVSQVFMGNSVSLLPMLVRRLKEHQLPKAKLLLTSPPYYGVTNYHYDQWLRLWLLGFEPQAYVTRGKYQGRFTNQGEYQDMLMRVFARASKAVKRNAVVYVRTSKDPFTRQATLDALVAAFPQKRLIERCRPFRRPTQTHLFGDKTPKKGEVDLVLEP